MSQIKDENSEILKIASVARTFRQLIIDQCAKYLVDEIIPKLTTLPRPNKDALQVVYLAIGRDNLWNHFSEVSNVYKVKPTSEFDVLDDVDMERYIGHLIWGFWKVLEVEHCFVEYAYKNPSADYGQLYSFDVGKCCKIANDPQLSERVIQALQNHAANTAFG
jgi:hypothetical protein